MRVVSAWYDQRDVHVVEARGTRRFHRQFPAMWTVFLENPPPSVASSASTLEAVVRTRLVDSGRHLRIDCRDSESRRAVRDALAEEFGRDRVREGDVDPVTRFVADTEAVAIHDDYRVLYLDVEAQKEGFSIDDARAGKVPILAWAAVGSDDQRYSSVLSEDDSRAEIEHLDRLMAVMRGYDVIVGWFLGDVRPGTGFDADVIRNRFAELGIDPPYPWARWCWLDQMAVWKKFTQGDGAEKASNRLADVAAQILPGDIGKLDVDAGRVWELWSRDAESRASVGRYCERDADLLPMIEERTGFLELFFALCRICRVFPNTWSLQATAQGDGYLLSLGHRVGHRWPTRWPRDDDVERVGYTGGYVLPPARTGVIEDVFVVDFSGMYTGIMTTWNMSPETRITGVTDAPVCRVPDGDVAFRTDSPGIIVRAIDEFRTLRARYKKEARQYAPGTPEYRRCQANDGGAKIAGNSMYGIVGSVYSRFFDPAMAEAITGVGQWMVRSVIRWAREDGWDVVYGDTDSVFVAMPRIEGLHARARAWVVSGMVDGQDLDDIVAGASAEQVSQWGFSSPEHMRDAFGEWAANVRRWMQFVADVNQRWTGLVRDLGVTTDPLIHLDWEKGFSRWLPVKKKRYAGRHLMYKGGLPDLDAPAEVRGLEMKRSDVHPLARAMQEQFLGLFLGTGEEDDPPIPSADEISGWIDGWRSRLLDTPVTLSDVVLSQSVSKPVDAYFDEAPFSRTSCVKCPHEFGDKRGAGPAVCPRCGTRRARNKPGPHIQVARQIQSAGGSVLPGDRIRWVAVLGEDGKNWTPVSADTPDVLARIDLGYYWWRTLRPTLNVVSAIYPDDGWDHYSRDQIAIRRGLMRARAVVRDGDLPLFRQLIPEVVPATCTIVFPLGFTAADVGLVQAACQRSPGPTVLELACDVEVDGELVRVVMSTGDSWSVDHRLLAAASPRIQLDSEPGTFRLLLASS